MSRKRGPWITLAVLVLAALVPYAVPPLARFRPVTLDGLTRAFVDPFRGRPRAPLWRQVRPPDELPGPAGPQADLVPASPDASRPTPAGPRLRALSAKENIAGPEDLLTDPASALTGFYAALAGVEQGEGVIRILHLGDSVVTGDLITGEARARLQKAYGNGGPGWIYLAPPWEWYSHLGLSLKGDGWKIHSPLLTARKDRRYGLAGLAFSSQRDASTTLSPAKNYPFSRVQVYYLAQPKGGSLLVRVDDRPLAEVSTAGEQGPASQELPLAGDAPHFLSLRTKGDGEVTLYGLALERGGPGVIYDALGSNGGAIRHLARIDREDWIQAVRARRPDLVILAFGTNEVGYYNIPGPAYAADYKEVVRRIRTALPQASILIMGPMDRGERSEDGEIVSMPKLLRIVEAQREIARELGCAFFDTFRAMGGEGAAGRWYLGTPRLMSGDFMHPTRPGADALAKLFVEALQQGYAVSRKEEPSGSPQEDGAVGEAGAEGGHHRR